MDVTLSGGPHDGRRIHVDPDDTSVVLPVIEPRADGGPPDLGDATYRRDDSGQWWHVRPSP